MKFAIKDFFSKYDQICSFLRIWSHLLKKSFMENFIFLCSAFLSPWKCLLLKCDKQTIVALKSRRALLYISRIFVYVLTFGF